MNPERMLKSLTGYREPLLWGHARYAYIIDRWTVNDGGHWRDASSEEVRRIEEGKDWKEPKMKRGQP